MTSGSFANRAFWVMASIALGLLILFLVVFVSWINRLHGLRAMEADAQARLADLKSAVTSVNTEDLQEQNRRLDAVLSVLELELPQAAYVPTLVKQVESEAVLTGNTQTEARMGELLVGKVITRTGTAAPGTSPPAPPPAAAAPAAGGAAEPAGQRYDEQQLSLRFKGSYHSGFRLLKSMGSLRKMLYVKEITIQRTGSDFRADGGAEAEIGFDVSAFVLEPAGGFPGKVVAQVHD